MKNKRLGLGLRGLGSGHDAVSSTIVCASSLQSFGRASAWVLAACGLFAAGQPANATVIACNPNASSVASGCTATGGFNFPATDGTGYFSNVTGSGANGAGLSSATLYGSYATATGARATAIGLGATAGQGAIAIGSQQFTGQDAATGAPTGGTPTSAAGLNSIAIGAGAVSNAAYAIAQGFGATAGAGGITSGGQPTGGIAIGTGAVAGTIAAGSSLALGNYASATAPVATNTGDSVAIGTQTTANAVDSIAIGAQTTASAVNTIAVGNNGTLNAGANSVVIGVSSTALAAATGSVVLGSNSTANAANETVLGRNASSTAIGGVALGNGSVQTRAGLLGGTEAFSQTIVTSGNGSVSVGSAGNERQITNVAGGTQATDAVNVRQLRAVGDNLATSLGGAAAFDPTTGAYTAPTYTVGAATYNNVGAAITALDAAGGGGGGVFASDNTAGAPAPVATGANASAGGYGSSATGAGSTVVGNGAKDNGNANAVAVGNNANALAANAIAIGAGTTANGATNGQSVIDFRAGGTTNSQIVNLAAGTTAMAPSGVAIGQGSIVNAGGGVALGYNNSAGGMNAGNANSFSSTAIGSSNLASAGYATAIGVNNQATNTSAVALGVNNQATGLRSIAIGRQSYANGDFSIAQGSLASGYGANSVAIGANSVAGVSGGAATNDVALGSGATSTLGNSVALGAGSVASRGAETNYAGYAVGTQTSAGELAVGTAAAPRTVTGVGAGRLGTDAVNVSQLSAVGTNLATSLGGGAGFNATTGVYTAPAYTVGGQTYNNVGAALAAGNALSVQYTPNAAGAPTNVIDLTRGGTLAPVAMTGLANATTATGAVTLGQTPLQYSTAGAPTTANPAVPSNDVTLVGANAGAPVSLHNLAAGTLTATSTDAVNGSQLFTTNQAIAALGNGTAGLVQQAGPGAPITVGAGTDGTTVAFANNVGAARTLTGVAAGTVAANSTEAVNGGQLFGTAGSVANALGGGSVVNADGTVSAPTYAVNGTNYGNVGGAIGGINTAITPLSNYFKSNSVGPVASATGTDAVAIGSNATSTVAGGVALGTNAVAGRAGLGGATEAFTGAVVASTQGAVSVGDVGAERQITNLAGGTQDTDAVNLRQLRSVGTNLAGSLGGGAAFDPTTGAYTAPAYLVGGQTYGTVGAALAAGNALSVQYTPDVGGAPTNAIDLTKGGTLAPVAMTGLANATTASGAVTLGQSPLQYSTAAAPTTANPAVSSNDVTLVGANAGAPVAVHNVADGTLAAGSTDAVNGGQLFTTNQAIAGLTNGTAGLVQQNQTTRAISVGGGTDGITVGFANNTGAARTLTGVAAGTVAAGSTEAVNGGQLAGTAGSVATALGGGSVVNPDGTVSAPTYNVANGTYNDVGSALTALDNGIATGKLGAFVSNNTSNRAAPTATGADASAGGFGASATGANSTVIGGNATDNGAANATILGSNGSVTQVGGVALGAGSAATRAALAGANEAFSGTAVGSTQAAVSVGAAGAERQITNVAGGTQDTDAVNLRQLRAVGTNVATSLGGGAGFDPATGAYTAPTYTVGGQAYNDVGSALAAGNALAVQYTPNAAGGATNAIDLTKGGTLAPVAMTGLAAGALTATSTDAVNGSQLFATNQQLAALAGGTAGLVQQDPATRAITVGGATDGTTVGFANNAGAARTLTGVAAGTVAAGSTQAVNGGQLAGTAGSVATALGGGAAVNPDGTVSAPTYAVGGQNYNNVGGAITALDSTGVKYDTVPGTGAKGQSITLAGGDPNQPVVIRNVAAGIARTDAANVGQVQDAETRANQYTNQRVAGLANQMAGVNDRLSGLESNIAETKREARQGAAIGLAAASLRYDDRPGKVSVAAGGGYWRGEAAGAFGLGYTLPDGRFRVNATVATTGSAVGAGAGATYTFN